MSDGPTQDLTAASRSTGHGQKVLGSASWLVAGSILIRLFSVLNIFVLSRILSPDDFGTMALALIAVGLSTAFINRQFDLILIRTHDLEREHFDNAFTMSILMGVFLAGAICCAAAVFSWFGNDKFSLIYLSVAALPLIDSLKSTRFLKFEQANNMRPNVIVGLVGKIVQIAVGIGLALWLQNYWALIIAAYGFSITRAVLTYVFAPYRPRICFTQWKMFLGVGGWLSGVGFIGYGMTAGDTVIVGIFMTTTAVGYLSISLELIRLTSDFVANSLSRAIYPAFARMRDDKQRVMNAYAKSQALVMFLMFPIGCGLGLTASEFIPLFLGTSWLAAVPVIQIIAPFNALGMLVYMIQPILIAQNDVRSLFLRNLAVFVVFVLGLFLLVPTLGLLGAALSRIPTAFVHVILSIKRAETATQLNVAGHLRLLWRSLVATFTMTAVLLALWPISNEGDSGGTTLAFILAAKIFMGGTTYCLTHGLLWLVSGRPKGVETHMFEIASGVVSKVRSKL
ncbi:oligosaccharide flippase family protein [uncultured Roseibium sp.]|uniref:oligosaccharide flippase family protein n=1 Tax=uncultured Roseibium sp. TaxID=1936171 RepID=UPI00262DB8E8|nr:oligosaccharide flippase family protein [uncultured Roseibium sp.]